MLNVAAIIAGVLIAAPVATPPASNGYVLIVTNNRSLTPTLPNLDYADDDGVKYAELFGEIYGEERVTLLTHFDPDTARLYKEWTDRVERPTRDNVRIAVEKLALALRGNPTAEVVVVFAGHGDTDENGDGFIDLEDGRFTALDLDHELLAVLRPARVHLILDSCHSHSMLHARGSTKERFSVKPKPAPGLLDKYPNVGALISTSEEAVTFEWSEVQSGIFSYELRSALRGAADVDGDGCITYAEVEAFIAVANGTLVNALYQPKTFAQGPGRDNSQVLAPPFIGHSRMVHLPAAGARRLTIRDRNGVRLLDMHKEDGTAVTLHLPERETDVEVEQVTPGVGAEARPTVTVWVLPEYEAGAAAVELDGLVGAPPVSSKRGDSPVFKEIFSTPFGKAAFAAHHPPTPEQRVFGISRQDVQRLEMNLHLVHAFERNALLSSLVPPIAGVVVGGGGAAVYNLTAQGKFLGSHEQGVLVGELAASVAIATALGIVFLGTDTAVETILQTYADAPKLTTEQRAMAVLRAEVAFDGAARRAGRQRLLAGATESLVGAAALPYLLSRSVDLDTVAVAVSAGLVVAGLYTIFFSQQPVELFWQFYQEQRAQFGTSMPDLFELKARGGFG